MTDLRKLLDNMNQIDENPLVGLAVGAAGSMLGNALSGDDEVEEAWDQELNHGLSDEDAPYNDHDADYEATLQGEDPHKDDWMMRGGEDGLGPDGDGRHDRHDEFGEDPWGLGEDDRAYVHQGMRDRDGDRGEIASDAFAQGINDPEACPDCLGSGTRTKAMWGPDAGYCEKCDGSGEIGFDPGPEGDRGEMASELYDDERGENVPDDVQMHESPSPREMTNKLHSAAEDGYIDWESLAGACLNWMSEHEVAQMYDQEFDWLDEEMGESMLTASEEDEFIIPDGEQEDQPDDGDEYTIPNECDSDDGLGDDPWGIGDVGKDGTAVERVQDRVAARYGDETTEAYTPPVATSGVRG